MIFNLFIFFMIYLQLNLKFELIFYLQKTLYFTHGKGDCIMDVRIKEVRKEFGDTLQSLARKIDYDYSNLSKVERGIYTPSLELLNKIAEVYKIEIIDLLCTSTSDTPKNVSLEQKSTSERYLLSLDGEQISEDELDFLIHSVRIFRDKLNKFKNNNK